VAAVDNRRDSRKKKGRRNVVYQEHPTTVH